MPDHGQRERQRQHHGQHDRPAFGQARRYRGRVLQQRRRAVAGTRDRGLQQGDIDPGGRDFCGFRGQIHRCRHHARHACQCLFDMRHTRRAGHAGDLQTHRFTPDGVAGVLDRGMQRVLTDRCVTAHRCPFGRRIHAGRRHARHPCERLLDTRHARRTGHAFDVEHPLSGAVDPAIARSFQAVSPWPATCIRRLIKCCCVLRPITAKSSEQGISRMLDRARAYRSIMQGFLIASGVFDDRIYSS
jgi:hypothetical protein